MINSYVSLGYISSAPHEKLVQEKVHIGALGILEAGSPDGKKGGSKLSRKPERLEDYLDRGETILEKTGPFLSLKIHRCFNPPIAHYQNGTGVCRRVGHFFI